MEENENNEQEIENPDMAPYVEESAEESEAPGEEAEFTEPAEPDLAAEEAESEMAFASDEGLFDHLKPAPVDPIQNMVRLLDVEMDVTVQFGKTEIPLRDAVSFGVGSMIELNRSVDEPVELLVNNYPFARGEVVVIDGYYGVKITEIGSPEERSQTLLKNSGN